MLIALCIIGYSATVIIAAAISHIYNLPIDSEIGKDDYFGDIGVGLFWPIVLVLLGIAGLGKLAVILTKLLEKQMLYYLTGRKEAKKDTEQTEQKGSCDYFGH